MLPSQISNISAKELAEWKCHPVTIGLFKYYEDLITAFFVDMQRRIMEGEFVSVEEQRDLYMINTTLDKQVMNIQYDTNNEGRHKTILELYQSYQHEGENEDTNQDV